jgi:hypothetical protein
MSWAYLITNSATTRSEHDVFEWTLHLSEVRAIHAELNPLSERSVRVYPIHITKQGFTDEERREIDDALDGLITVFLGKNTISLTEDEFAAAPDCFQRARRALKHHHAKLYDVLVRSDGSLAATTMIDTDLAEANQATMEARR